MHRQLADAKQTIDELTGQDTKLLRIPRGVLTGDAADILARLGYDVLLWTAIITRNAAECYPRLRTRTLWPRAHSRSLARFRRPGPRV